MGVDDLIDNEKEFPVGSVEGKKKLENVYLSRRAKKWMIVHHPHYFTYDVGGMTEGDAKRLVEELDKVIQDKIRGISSSEGNVMDAKEVREEIIDAKLK